MDKTVVVLCTYNRTFTGDWNGNILKFKNQEFPHFEILFDNQTNLPIDEISKNYGDANICLFNDKDFEINNFNRLINLNHRWGNHQNPKYFYAHFRMLTYFIKNPNYDYYWFFDDDVSFEGNLKMLLSNYNNIGDDFISIQAFKKSDVSAFPNISIINSKMEGNKGNWLNMCPGPGDNFPPINTHLGSFFPIIRLSKKAMEYLLSLNEMGYFGYSEGFVPTVLGSANFNLSSMMDEFNNFYIENNVCVLYHKGIKFTWEWL